MPAPRFFRKFKLKARLGGALLLVLTSCTQRVPWNSDSAGLSDPPSPKPSSTTGVKGGVHPVPSNKPGITGPTGVPSPVNACPAVPGTPWIPSIPSAKASNHDSTVLISKELTSIDGPVIGLAQPFSPGQLITFTINMNADLGVEGSLSLVAETTHFPSALSGGAYPLLVSLSDGVSELVNLSLGNSQKGCFASGLYTCSAGGDCSTPSTSCQISWPSAFTNRSHWEQRQFSEFGNLSVNTVPSCNWSGGSANSPVTPACAFNTTFFPKNITPLRLRHGTTYTAKYLLLADQYSTLSGQTATLNFTVIKKTDQLASGGLDLNVVLVGKKNVTASRTARGKVNLDTLFQGVYDLYNQSRTRVKLGKINVIEWPCDDPSGEAYSNVDLSELGNLIKAGTPLIPSGSEAKALNLYLVSTIPDKNTAGTILGLSAAIGGPMINGTETSGLVFGSFNQLDQYNPQCIGDPCRLSTQESQFVDMTSTIAHEMGHYLGLNHPSESDGNSHDMVLDTPVCTKTESISGVAYLTINSCYQDTHSFLPTGKTCKTACPNYDPASGVFCPDQPECQFNHVMWWTSKGFSPQTATGDGNIFSDESSMIINYNPFVQ